MTPKIKNMNSVLVLLSAMFMYGGISYVSKVLNLYYIAAFYSIILISVMLVSINTVKNRKTVLIKPKVDESENTKKLSFMVAPFMIIFFGYSGNISPYNYLIIIVFFIIQADLIINLKKDDVKYRKIDKLWLSKLILLGSLVILVMMVLYDLRGVIPYVLATVSIYTFSGAEA